MLKLLSRVLKLTPGVVQEAETFPKKHPLSKQLNAYQTDRKAFYKIPPQPFGCLNEKLGAAQRFYQVADRDNNIEVVVFCIIKKTSMQQHNEERSKQSLKTVLDVSQRKHDPIPYVPVTHTCNIIGTSLPSCSSFQGFREDINPLGIPIGKFI